MAAGDRGPAVVCDAGPLIHLDELGCLDLLNEFREILVPSAVWDEVKRHRPSALRRRRVVLIRVGAVPELTEEMAALLGETPLDLGEEHALRLVLAARDAILLTDDAAARLVATRLGLVVHGTLGVLLLGRQHGRRSRRQLLNLLRAVPRRSTLHVAKNLLNSLIADVEADEE